VNVPADAFAPALDVANAVLYEGYILYPYTASARKNRIRWQFGVVVPRAYAACGTGEPADAQTGLFVEADEATGVEIVVRFLQVEARSVEAWSGAGFAPVESLTIGDARHLTFDEGVEREVRLHVCPAHESSASAAIVFDAEENVEELHDSDGALRGRVVRRRWPLRGTVAVTCAPVDGHASARELRVRIENDSIVVPGERSCALRTAFVSTHTLLHATNGRFVSVLDPPPDLVDATKGLVNRHTWPVLVGDQSDPQRSALALSSPIILYDFPAVAPQTEGDTFDSLEIDELMMLSVRSLSDRERAEAKATDPRARAIVERAERFDAAELGKLHGTLLQEKREPVPAAMFQEDPFSSLDVPGLDCVFVDGVKIAKGSTVRLHPKRRADAWDIFLDGKLATVRAIHQDVEDLMYVAVTVDDDPASDLHEWYGRSFFFYPDEVEPASDAVAGA
jgi:hypothetical protein